MMPTKEIPTGNNKLAEGAKTYGQIGGVVAAVIMAMWPHTNPASMMDQGVVDASVTVATRQVVDDAEAKIDAKVDKEVTYLKESMVDKIESLKTAIVGLKALAVEKVKSAEREANRLREEVRDLKEALYDSRGTTRDLERQLSKVQTRLSHLEQAFDAAAAIDYRTYEGMAFEELGSEELGIGLP